MSATVVSFIILLFITANCSPIERPDPENDLTNDTNVAISSPSDVPLSNNTYNKNVVTPSSTANIATSTKSVILNQLLKDFKTKNASQALLTSNSLDTVDAPPSSTMVQKLDLPTDGKGASTVENKEEFDTTQIKQSNIVVTKRGSKVSTEEKTQDLIEADFTAQSSTEKMSIKKTEGATSSSSSSSMVNIAGQGEAQSEVSGTNLIFTSPSANDAGKSSTGTSSVENPAEADEENAKPINPNVPSKVVVANDSEKKEEEPSQMENKESTSSTTGTEIKLEKNATTVEGPASSFSTTPNGKIPALHTKNLIAPDTDANTRRTDAGKKLPTRPESADVLNEKNKSQVVGIVQNTSSSSTVRTHSIDSSAQAAGELNDGNIPGSTNSNTLPSAKTIDNEKTAPASGNQPLNMPSSSSSSPKPFASSTTSTGKDDKTSQGLMEMAEPKKDETESSVAISQNKGDLPDSSENYDDDVNAPTITNQKNPNDNNDGNIPKKTSNIDNNPAENSGEDDGVEVVNNDLQKAKGNEYSNYNKHASKKISNNLGSGNFRTSNYNPDSQGGYAAQDMDGDEEVGGVFNYFLTFAVLCGVCFLLFHNKKRIIAMVVEGRKPRGTGRRRSSSGSYRKLENNFD